MTRKELEESRHRGINIYGYKKAFCLGQSCCENCDKNIRFWCKVIRKIEEIQKKRILKICKEENTNDD